jgi:hypothetical protein
MMSVLPLGDEVRGGTQSIAFGRKRRQRGFRFRDQLA